MKKLLTLTLAATLAGCALGPDYARPEIDTPQTYRWQAQADGTSFGELGWWSVYQDPVLQQLIQTALTQNLDVRIAATRVEQARAALGSSRLGLLPNLGARGSATREQASSYEVEPGAERLGESGSASLNLSWEIDLWGRLRRANEAARAELLGSQYTQQGVIAGLVADVATAYFTLIALDDQLQITQRTLGVRQQFLDLTKAQFERGVISGLDVNTAEAQLAIAEANVPELERRIAIAEDQLSLLLGRNPGDILRDARSQAAHPLPVQAPAGLTSTLLERRPDLRQAEAVLIAANARVGVAKAALFPTISLTGAFGSLSTDLSELFTGPAETWSVGVGLVQPLIDADRNLYQLDLADARKREAILLYQKAVQTAFGEVADALIGRQKYEEFRLKQQKQVDALRNASQIALMRYKVGYSSYFDVINADRDLFGAELALSNAWLNSLTSTVRLYQALGGGWQAPQTAANPAN